MGSIDQIKFKVKPTEVSPFVWSRIQARLENESEVTTSPSFSWHFAIIACILIVNAFGIFTYKKVNSSNQYSNSIQTQYISQSIYSMIQYE